MADATLGLITLAVTLGAFAGIGIGFGIGRRRVETETHHVGVFNMGGSVEFRDGDYPIFRGRVMRADMGKGRTTGTTLVIEALDHDTYRRTYQGGA